MYNYKIALLLLSLSCISIVKGTQTGEAEERLVADASNPSVLRFEEDARPVRWTKSKVLSCLMNLCCCCCTSYRYKYRRVER